MASPFLCEQRDLRASPLPQRFPALAEEELVEQEEEELPSDAQEGHHLLQPLPLHSAAQQERHQTDSCCGFANVVLNARQKIKKMPLWYFTDHSWNGH